MGFAEPTCFSLLALGGESGPAPNAVAWLERVSARGRIEFRSSAPTATDAFPPIDTWGSILALFTLTRLGLGSAVAGRLRQYILTVRGNDLQEGEASRLKIEGQTQGWLWSANTTSWVEPTSLAVLALKLSGDGAHPRVREGERYLADRACYGGGWNYGNKEVLGVRLEAWPTVTACALLALQDQRDTMTARAADWLEDELGRHQSAMSLSLGILALDAHQRQTGRWIEALAKRQRADGSWRGNCHLTAAALLGLGVEGGENPFRMRGQV